MDIRLLKKYIDYLIVALEPFQEGSQMELLPGSPDLDPETDIRSSKYEGISKIATSIVLCLSFTLDIPDKNFSLRMPFLAI